MYNFVVYCAFALVIANALPARDDMISDTDAMAFLEQYGFAGTGNPDPRIQNLVSDDPAVAMETGIRMFQQMYGLDVTGVIDQATSMMMTSDRCGNKDIVRMSDMFDMDTSGSAGRRRRRYAADGNPWPNSNIRYIITQYPQDGDLSRSQVDSEIARAFQVWADVTPLTFTRVSSPSNAEMVIQFAAGDHGDGNAFDGRGRVLAHAYLPFNHRGIEGDTHFDEDEVWTAFSYSGTNLYLVAAHEFGHALGLGHSDVQGALMYPYYAGYIPDFTLPSDDVMGIQALYGPPEDGNGDGDGDGMGGNGGTNPMTFPPGAPDLCRDPSIDAITYITLNDQSALAVFKDNYYALIGQNGIVTGYPRLISADFQGVSGSIDAALYLPAVEGQGRWQFNYDAWRWDWVTANSLPAVTLLFQGSYYYMVGEDRSIQGGRRPVSELGMPADIDAIFVWARNEQIYAAKGTQYYRFTRQSSPVLSADSDYPRGLSAWNLPVSTVDAAIKAGDNNYWVKDGQLYLYDNDNIQVASGYPRSMSLVYGCSGNLADEDTSPDTMGNDINGEDGQSNAADSQTLSYAAFMSMNCLMFLYVLLVL